MLYRTSNRVLNNGIKVIILICMDGTSQYHHHRTIIFILSHPWSRARKGQRTNCVHVTMWNAQNRLVNVKEFLYHFTTHDRLVIRYLNIYTLKLYCKKSLLLCLSLFRIFFLVMLQRYYIFAYLCLMCFLFRFCIDLFICRGYNIFRLLLLVVRPPSCCVHMCTFICFAFCNDAKQINWIELNWNKHHITKNEKNMGAV